MKINTNELKEISTIRQRLDDCHVNLYSLKVLNELKDNKNKVDKKNFSDKRVEYGIYVAEFRNEELESILGWLKTNQKSLLDGITNLENKIDDFNDLAATTSAIASVVSILSDLITGLPLP